MKMLTVPSKKVAFNLISFKNDRKLKKWGDGPILGGVRVYVEGGGIILIMLIRLHIYIFGGHICGRDLYIGGVLMGF